MGFLNDINKLSKSLDRIPVKAGAVSVRFFKNRFRDANWIDTSVERWPKRKRDEYRKKRSRALLVQSGRLKRSIRAHKVSPYKIIISTDVPYAQVHNEGFKGTVNIKTHVRKRGEDKITVQSHTRKMVIPKRQFMGESHYLSKQVERMMLAEIKRALK